MLRGSESLPTPSALFPDNDRRKFGDDRFPIGFPRLFVFKILLTLIFNRNEYLAFFVFSLINSLNVLVRTRFSSKKLCPRPKFRGII